MPTKQIKLKKRLYNIWTHLKEPLPFMAVAFGMGLIMMVFILAFPCGKHAHPVNGVCSNNSAFLNPVHWFIAGTFISFLLEVLQASSYENKKSYKSSRVKVNIVEGASSYFQRWPNWRKKWYPVCFIAMYILFACFIYIWDRSGGLNWYHYVGQFGIMVPLFAGYLADLFVTKVRKMNRHK